jgi:hypothetical protein
MNRAVHFGNFQKQKEKSSHKKTLIKDKDILNNKSITKNISDLMFKIPKKKLVMGNNSSLGD